MSFKTLRSIAWLLPAVLVLSIGPRGEAAKWEPVDPAELALAAPKVDKNADAEAILWDVTVTDLLRDDQFQTAYEYYLRIKLFTDRGRDAQSRVDLPHRGTVRIYDVEGRSIKRDGSVVELKPADVFERDLIRAGGVKVKATSFALPGAETGGLLEYRWRETHQSAVAHNLRLPFSRDIPVHLVKYHIKPLATMGSLFTLRLAPFRCEPTPLVQEGPGKMWTSLSNVPAFRDEPRAPSEWALRPWLLVYYDARSAESSPKIFWQKWSKEVFDASRDYTSPNGAVKKAAAELRPADTHLDATIEAILGYCRTRITRMDLDTTSDAARKGFKGNKRVQDVLKSGRGTGDDLRALFIALARARGLDARLVLLPSRADVAFDASRMLPQLFQESIVAIKDGDAWRFVDPANPYGASGRLRWTQEGHQVLIPDPDGVVTAATPTSPPDTSTRRRVAKLVLLEDGTLEGDVVGEATGHRAVSHKEGEAAMAAADREKALVATMTERLPGAEISNAKVEHVTDPDRPYTYSFHLRVPGYAQRAGSRLFVQPAVLQKGLPPEFGAATRVHPMMFDYAWREIDEVELRLPPGYQLEPATLPADLKLEDVAAHAVAVTTPSDGAPLGYRRTFFFGGGGRLAFLAPSYPAVKRFFDEVAKRDGLTITLRRAPAAGQP